MSQDEAKAFLPIGSNWKAQIVYGAAAKELGPVMDFRPVTSPTLAGSWVPTSNGGSNDRIMDGVAPGSSVILTVRVWDSAVFASWTQASEALTAGTLPATESHSAGPRHTRPAFSHSFSVTS